MAAASGGKFVLEEEVGVQAGVGDAMGLIICNYGKLGIPSDPLSEFEANQDDGWWIRGWNGGYALAVGEWLIWWIYGGSWVNGYVMVVSVWLVGFTDWWGCRWSGGFVLVMGGRIRLHFVTNGASEADPLQRSGGKGTTIGFTKWAS